MPQERPWVGIDVGQRFCAVAVVGRDGKVLEEARITVDGSGKSDLLILLRRHAKQRPGLLHVGVEDPHGVVASTLSRAGYAVHSIRPISTAHARGRASAGGAKDDRLDAILLANLLRTEPLGHRRVPNNSTLVEEMFVLERAHLEQGKIVRSLHNRLHANLASYYPEALKVFGNLTTLRARITLELTPSPSAAKHMTVNRLQAEMESRGLHCSRATVSDLLLPLRMDSMRLPHDVEHASGLFTVSLIHSLTHEEAARDGLERNLITRYERHPAHASIASFPGLGGVLGARMLSEFGDDPSRFNSAHGWQALAGVRPITKASGMTSYAKRRYIHNRIVGSAAFIWILPLMHGSPAARLLYKQHRNNGDTHGTATRKVSCVYLGILWQCVRDSTLYNEEKALSRFERKTLVTATPEVPTSRQAN